MNVDSKGESKITKISQQNIKADKRVPGINIYQINNIFDYNMFGKISKQQSTSRNQPYSRRKQQVLNIQEASIYFWNTTSK